MDCRTAQSLVMGYINKTLSWEELEAFISHVRRCPECYDELETYFTVFNAIRHLDGDKGGTMNMTRLLEQDLKRREGFVRRRKGRRAFLLVFLGLCILLLAFLLLWLFL